MKSNISKKEKNTTFLKKNRHITYGILLILCCMYCELLATTDEHKSVDSAAFVFQKNNKNIGIDLDEKLIYSKGFAQQSIWHLKLSVEQQLKKITTQTAVINASCDGSAEFITPVSNLGCNASSNDIRGTVFEDFNYDGDYDLGENLGVESVTVTATDAFGNTFSDITDTNGNFIIATLTAGRTYRIEFSNLPSWASPTFYGADNGTLIQFVTPGNCANLGLASPPDYCQDNPLLAVPCYVNGNPLGGGTSGTEEWFVYFRNNNQGEIGQVGYTAPEIKINGTVIGATWGTAYHRQTKTVLASAVMKRHSGFGQNGTGAIYKINASGTPTLFVNLNNYSNVNTGSDTRGTTNNTLPSNFNVANRDINAFQAVGKVGIGDIDFSDDEKFLYAINLNERTLVELAVNSGLTVPATVTTYNIATAINNLVSGTPIACGSVADYRPWALKYHKGLLYIGVVCSAENSQVANQLHAYVLSFDPSNPSNGFTLVTDMSLDYAREPAFQSDVSSQTIAGTWRPWALDYTNATILPWRGAAHPSPILADIEFDIDGSLILGFMDRFGMQSGYRQLTTNLGDSNADHQGIGAGDVIRFCNVNGTLVQEGQAGCPYNVSPPWTNPGNFQPQGEFYANEEFFTTITNPSHGHPETSLGGLALLAGSGELTAGVYDPFALRSGGIAWWDNTNGAVNKEYELYEALNQSTPDGSFSKAVGLGDLEYLCEPAPIQIGNYVWKDTNNNGIQDAGEPGIDGVLIEIWKGGTLIATTQTDNGGQYYFSNNNASDNHLTWNGTAADVSLLPNTAYTIVINNADGGNQQTPLEGLFLTTTNANSNNNDEVDNDAALNGNKAEIGITTSDAGQVAQRFDAGFAQPCKLNIINVYSDNCTGDDTNGYTADWNISISALSAPDAAISYQRNSEAIQMHTLTGTTDTIIITGVPADGASGDMIRIYFTNDHTCGDTVTLKRPIPCPSTVGGFSSPAEVCQNLDNTKIGGTVFEDWNYDGAMNQSDTVGVQGVQVYLYDDCGNITQTTYTDKNGNYLFNGLTTGKDYRIEFTLTESIACWAKPTKAGPDNGTTVQFVQPGNCANLGVASPSDYCDDMPRLIISCYENGKASTNMNPALVSFSYGASGLPAAYDGNTGTNGTAENPVSEVDISEIGAVNGSAWQAGKSRLFSATFLKRFVGFLDGPGYIYTTEFANGSATGVTKFNLQGVIPANGGSTIDFGTVCRDASCANDNGNTGFASDYELANSPTQQSIDLDAFAKVGAMSYGDIDLQEDGNTLWAVNLYQKALISIDVSGSTGSLPGTVNQYLLSDLSGVPSCSNGQIRPWGLAFDKGVGYIGIVCDASISLESSDLEAYILAFDPNNITMGFRTVLNFSLDFPREIGHITGAGFPTNMNWLAWVPDWNTLAPFTSNTDNNFMAPQPIIGDIAFNERGDMIIGFMDRFGHQNGRANKIAVSQTTQTGDTNSGGDLIHACFTGSVWILEGSSGCMNMDDNIVGDPFTQLLQNDGPNSNGEFYFEEYFTGDTTDTSRFIHAETSTGILSLTKGKREVISLHYDPLWGPPSIVNAQGIVWHDTYTGKRKDQYQVVESSGTGSETFAKANGLGDLQAMCSAAPIEIGNYVWIDKDRDGIQDACENPISGLIVSLYKNGTKIAETETSASGQYYFSDKNANDVNLTWFGTGLDTTLRSNMEYKIVFGESQYANNELIIGGEHYILTTQNAGGNDWIDSDAMEMDVNGTIFPAITAMTGDEGYVDHRFDVGFSLGCPPEVCLPVKTTIKKSNGTN